jgi:hypothetical protein
MTEIQFMKRSAKIDAYYFKILKKFNKRSEEFRKEKFEFLYLEYKQNRDTIFNEKTKRRETNIKYSSETFKQRFKNFDEAIVLLGRKLTYSSR